MLAHIPAGRQKPEDIHLDLEALVTATDFFNPFTFEGL